MAWLWLRHQPESKLSRWFHARTADASKRIKKIAIVALARQLVVALWRYLTTGLVPEGALIEVTITGHDGTRLMGRAPAAAGSGATAGSGV